MVQISNNEIKFIKSLSSKKYRDESGMFIVEGDKMVKEALASGFEVVGVYRRDEIGDEAMSRISQLSSPSPVLAVVKKPAYIENGCAAIDNGLFLALDAIRDPGNLGTILRISDWFGIRSVVASRDTVEIFNPKVVQSTMGAIFRVNFYYTDLEEFALSVLKQGGKIYGTFLNGDDMYGKVLDPGIDKPVVIVIGNEAKGISPGMEGLVSDRLFIPPFPADEPGSESLNAAVATAVTVAEFRRRARL